MDGTVQPPGFPDTGRTAVETGTKDGAVVTSAFADIDQFKQINDTRGQHVGDRALIDTAEIFRATFRDSDVVARLGGDEFVVSVLEADADCADRLVARLQKSLDLYHAQANRPYPLLLSVGTAQYNPATVYSIEELLAEADTEMYIQKRKRKSELWSEVV